MTLAIAEAGAGDIALISELAHDIWPAAYAGILTPEQIDNMLARIYSHENLRAEMDAGHRFWLARWDNLPCGFASSYRENTEIIWLKKIYIAPAMQGQGVGRALIRTIEQAMQPMKYLKLLVNPHNIPAQRYYSHNGFSPAGTKQVQMGDFTFQDLIFSKEY